MCYSMVINQKVANRWVARFIPLVLIAIVCYASYVVVGPVCVSYFLSPSATLLAPRPGAAAAVLAIYFILLFFVAITYFRILFTIIHNPGYVERGPQFYESRRAKAGTSGQWSRGTGSEGDKSGEKDIRNIEKGTQGSAQLNGRPYTGVINAGRPNPETESPGLQEFYRREVFVCEGDGRPIWCSMCMNWKGDRAHHCREVERCVKKMDHFCPWAGGIISETTFKFFVQFTSWTAIFCTFTAIVVGVCIGEVRATSQPINVHWIITIALAALFGFFALGMSLSSLQFVLLNTTSVENLSRKIKIWTLAVYIPRDVQLPTYKPFQTITYPLTPSTQGASVDPPRSFAILHSKVGENPFDLGPWGNFKDIMGTNILDWLVPLRYSPCCDHEHGESAFTLGPVVQRMREEAGIAIPRGEKEKKRRRRRHSRSHKTLESTPKREKSIWSPRQQTSTSPSTGDTIVAQ